MKLFLELRVTIGRHQLENVLASSSQVMYALLPMAFSLLSLFALAFNKDEPKRRPWATYASTPYPGAAPGAIADLVINGTTVTIDANQSVENLSFLSGTLVVNDGITLTIVEQMDIFPGATIVLDGSGKLAYSSSAILHYKGSVQHTCTAQEWPLANGPVHVLNSNTSTVVMPFTRRLTGSLQLASGNFIIGANAILELDGASLNSTAGTLSGNALSGATSSLVVTGSNASKINLPTNGNIGLMNVTVAGNRTLAMNGIHHINLSGLLHIGPAATFDNGGESQLINAGVPQVIIEGIFINRDKDNFTGTNGAIPGIAPVIGAASTIEYGLSNGNPQTVTARPDYAHISITGTGVKRPGSTFSPTGNVSITSPAIFDCSSHRVGGANTGLVMTGGRLIVGTGGVQPAMEAGYQLTGGVIEFAGASAKTIRPQLYQHIEVSGASVANSNGNITLRDQGTFTIKTGGAFTINDNTITGPAGTQTVSVEAGAIFNCGNNKGFHGFVSTLMDNSSLHANIEEINLLPGASINYARNGDQLITTSNNLVYQHLLLGGLSGNKLCETGTLTIMGNLVKSGASEVIANGSNIVFVNGGAGQQFSNTGSTFFATHNVVNGNTSAAGLSLESNLGVANELKLLPGSKLVLGAGNLHLISNNVVTARVAEIPPDAQIVYHGIGRFVVERYFPANRSWRLVTAPVSNANTNVTIFSEWQNNGNYVTGRGTLITGPLPGPANGLDASAQNSYSLKTIENSAMVNLGNTKVALSLSSISAANKGYFLFVRGDRNPANTHFPNSNITTLSARGQLQVGDQTFPGLERAAGNNSRLYSLVGNPYASPVDLGKVELTNTMKRFAVWNPHLNSVGGYVILDDTDNGDGIFTAIPDGSPGAPDGNIQSGQAFFVETGEAVGSSSITFKESCKTDSDNPLMFKPAPMRATSMEFKTKLYGTTSAIENLIDGNLVQFDRAFSAAVDWMDALKLGNINETFAVNNKGSFLALDRRPEQQQRDTIQFNLSKVNPGDYLLRFETKQPDPLISAVVQDRFTHREKVLALTRPDSFAFHVSASPASQHPDRFRVVFSRSASATLSSPTISLSSVPSSIGIHLQWQIICDGVEKIALEKSNDGVRFQSCYLIHPAANDGPPHQQQWVDERPFEGTNYYRLKVNQADGKIFFSNIVKRRHSSHSYSISLAVSHTPQQTVNLIFNNAPTGNYSMQGWNAQGQRILHKKFFHSRGNLQETIQFDSRLLTGFYQLEITDPAGKRCALKLLVP